MIYQTNKLLLDPTPVDGGIIPPPPANNDIPMPQELAMPESMKGKTFSLDADDKANLPELKGNTSDSGEDFAERKIKKVSSLKEDPTYEEKKEETVKPEEKKVEEKPKTGLNIPKSETFKEIVKEQTQADKESKGRDYSKYSPELAEALKSTPNKVFAVLEKHLAKINTSKDENGIPLNWHEHPQAYTLHPAYRESQTIASRASFESDFYTQQLEKIKAGESFCLIEGYNPQTGEPVYGNEITPDNKSGPGWESKLTRYMMTGYQIAQQHQNALNKFQGSFQQRQQSIDNYINKTLDEQWPWHKDESAPQQAVANEFLTAVPEEYRDHPASKIASYMYVTLQEALKKIDGLSSVSVRDGKLKEAKEKTEPNLGVNPGKGIGGKVMETVQIGNGKYQPPKNFDLAGM